MGLNCLSTAAYVLVMKYATKTVKVGMVGQHTLTLLSKQFRRQYIILYCLNCVLIFQIERAGMVYYNNLMRLVVHLFSTE